MYGNQTQVQEHRTFLTWDVVSLALPSCLPPITLNPPPALNFLDRLQGLGTNTASHRVSPAKRICRARNSSFASQRFSLPHTMQRSCRTLNAPVLQDTQLCPPSGCSSYNSLSFKATGFVGPLQPALDWALPPRLWGKSSVILLGSDLGIQWLLTSKILWFQVTKKNGENYS